MMNHSLKNQCKVSTGTIIQGKWHRNRYRIVKELGFGANGIVYLVQTTNKLVALKLSNNGLSITSEVNVLKSLAKVQGSNLGPSLLDVDDWEGRTSKISFYVMEYIKGTDLLTYIQQKGPDWTNVLILQLLSDLEKLHQNGWVFGDLKPENLIVTGPPPTIRCIDVGGTTLRGRAIKEFTEFFDRGYWGMGSRRAEPGYDLFAVAMIIINAAYPKRFSKTTGGINQLKDVIKQSKELLKIEEVLLKALQGSYSSANQMRTELLQVISHVPRNPPLSRTTRQQSKVRRKANVKRKSKSGRLETIIISSVILSLYIFYILSSFGG